jgi:hypothetical protein
MKLLLSLVAMWVFCGAAFAQVGGSPANGQAQMLTIAENRVHASQTGMAEPQDLLERSGNTAAQGERPLWEFMPPKPAGPPLGDVARELKKEHEAAKKATIIWTN